MPIISIELNDEEEKALLWDVIDIDLWARNALFNKIRRCADAICELAINDTTGTILSPEDKQALRTYLSNNNIDILTSIRQLPNNVKREIVKRANIKSAAERNAEEEAKLDE